jgi:phosphinothricin acetyltransferase
MRIDSATLDDAAAIAGIYAHHVLHGTATFETEPPGEAETRARIGKVLDAGWPWLVGRATDIGIVGYAYAAQFRDRPAYRFACEDSIYVAHDRAGQGFGGALLAALIAASRERGFRQMIAVIGGAEPASRALHARHGFVEAGRMRGVGFKHGRWLDTLYMQLALAAPEEF